MGANLFIVVAVIVLVDGVFAISIYYFGRMMKGIEDISKRLHNDNRAFDEEFKYDKNCNRYEELTDKIKYRERMTESECHELYTLRGKKEMIINALTK